MNEEPSLLSLPVEVVHLIGDYLSPRELVTMSGVCRYFRSVFNDNLLWKKYSEGGETSRRLDTSVSLVEPKFEIFHSSSLEPLCEHRIHFFKQRRLLNNLRQGRFVEHFIEFPNFISPPERPLKNRKITYGSKFLFTKNQGDDGESIRIYDIENSPTLLLSVDIEPHLDLCDLMWLQVAGDRVVVRRENWFSIYAINLPESLDILNSFNIPIHMENIGEQLIIGKYLFIENFESNVVHVWDLSDGSQCSDIRPIIGCDFSIINYSQNEQLVLFMGGLAYYNSWDPYVCVYDVDSNDFSSFKPVISKKDFKGLDCYGDIDSNYVVLLGKSSLIQNCSVFVFDYKKSTLVVKRSDLNGHGAADARLVSGYLVKPSEDSIHVMDLKSLQIVWEVQLVGQVPGGFILIDVLYIASLTSIMVIHKDTGMEIWDFNTRSKVLDMPEDFGSLNDSCSKLISYKSDRIMVRSFW